MLMFDFDIFKRIIVNLIFGESLFRVYFLSYLCDSYQVSFGQCHRPAFFCGGGTGGALCHYWSHSASTKRKTGSTQGRAHKGTELCL